MICKTFLELNSPDMYVDSTGIEAYGFLAFEKKDTQSVTWIKSEKFGSLWVQIAKDGKFHNETVGRELRPKVRTVSQKADQL